MTAQEPKRNVLLWLAAEAVIPVLGGCAGALAGGPVGGLAGVAVGHAVEKAISLFGRGIVERWQAWFAGNRQAAEEAVVALAALPPAEAQAEAKAVLERVADASAEDLVLALRFLSALPSSVNRALAAPPGGGRRTLPATVTLDDARSLLQLLPATLPPYTIPADLPSTPYRLLELLGAGGFGAVYRAVSHSLQHLGQRTADLGAALTPKGHDVDWPRLDEARWNFHPRMGTKGVYFLKVTEGNHGGGHWKRSLATADFAGFQK